ncbi:VWA domain-containing protein [Sphingomonas sp. AP4-R1]|uniref:VWA domain-containing protein n=1 Tax=Sphingomonas sp. AP4-R1 TaxID=2735134 RepID=UPI001493AF7E|nr:VWA domain-containing protein [Sphingomonas sp. AP4-R1]QJU57995.1 VWA domain-containing protein [Sphingomonas sp. AP4-R1]
MSGLRFEEPLALLALLLIPAAILWRMWRGRASLLVVPYAASWSTGGAEKSRWWIVAFYGAMALAVIALAQPQRVDSLKKIEQHGYDLMLAVDLSTSMLSEDYEGPKGRINRLETIRPIIRAFIKRRPNDRIGIVAFARRALTLAPLTTDHGWLDRQVAALKTGVIEDGTAIGDGLGIALTDLEGGRQDETQANGAGSVGAFIVLLTDGSSNSGDLTPPEATALARYRKVPVYAIGTGRNGMVPFPVFDAAGRRTGTSQQPSAIDIDALKTMANETGGRFFMAGDTAALEAAFRAIDAQRKAVFHVRSDVRVRELYGWFVGGSLLLLVAALPGLLGGLTFPRFRPRPA